MKKSIFYIALFMPSFLFVSAEKAQALPFKENCASLQAYANKDSWDPPTKFSGFENAEMEIIVSVSLYSCTYGYVTQTSPLGTLVCRARLMYTTGTPTATPPVPPDLSWDADRNYCRWK